MKTKKISMILEKTDTGYSAYSKNQPVYTTAGSMTELIFNAKEAVELYQEGRDTNTNYEMTFEIDFRQFFQYYRVLNSKFLAERIGMNPTLLSQYVQGRKKLSEKQKDKILAGIQQIGKELAEISLIL